MSLKNTIPSQFLIKKNYGMGSLLLLLLFQYIYTG